MKVYVLKTKEWSNVNFWFVTDKNSYKFDVKNNQWNHIDDKNTLMFEMYRDDVKKFFPEIILNADYSFVQEIKLSLSQNTTIDEDEQIKKRVENYLIYNEDAKRVHWFDDETCTSYDKDNEPIHDYTIKDVDEDGDIVIVSDEDDEIII